MNLWVIAATALAMGLVPCWLTCLFGNDPMDRLVALEMATTLTALVIVLLAEGFERVSLYDLALTVTLLSFGSTLVFTHFLERWL